MRLILTTTVFLVSLFNINFMQADYRESFKGREWEFLQYELRTKFDHNLNHFMRMFRWHSSGIIGLSIGLFNYLTKDIDLDSSLKRDFYLENLRQYDHYFGITFFGGLAAILFYMSHVKHWAILRTYENFIRNWPQNKPFVPEHYKELLDTWYVAYLEFGPESTEYHAKRCLAMSIIEQALDNKFPSPVQINNTPYVITIPVRH